MLGSAANDALSTIFPKIDAEMAKLFEDRNVLLTDGGIITFTGTQIQFTEDLRIAINQNIAGAAPYVASLGQATITLANNEMVWAIVNRTGATATLAQGLTMPAVNSTNQEVFLIAKRVDAGDGTQRVYWRTGMAQNAGQSNRLGASGSGSGGSGIGDDLGVLLFQASFRDPFEEGPTDVKSAVNTTSGFTDPATYNAAKAMYTVSYDASKTIAAGTTTTNINLSAVASFTVKIGDVVIANNQARRITAVASQQSFTTEAFTTAPTLASQVTVSQAIYTKDIYNFAVDGNALSAEFGATTFQEVMFDYEDTSASGDNIFDVNVAPVIGLSASHDGTSFTDVKIRPTLGTSTIQSFALPAAGTGLSVRFFAYKQSGSGTVNILGYRAFMQKQNSTGTAGGITNSAYAFTNSVGTPINCSVGVSGGKTTITLNWQYAVGVYAGTTASAIEVWLNGQKLPRFVDSTLTPDGSFTETTSSVITLDKDYSSLNLSVEVFQRTQIVDNSTINTTNISNLQQMQASAFQGFVNQNQLMNATSVAGTPVAGQFYSSIPNRAAMIDISQDLKVRMGTDRVHIQNIYQIQNEFGPNGEAVFAANGDIFGQVRVVGSASNVLNASAPRVSLNLAGDYIEIVFYGTGLNILTDFYAGAQDVRSSVDGGAEGVNLWTGGTGYSSALTARNYATNNIMQVASNLPLGVHTVKVRLAIATSGISIFGFEALTATSAIQLNPGISYVNGLKLVTTGTSTTPYNSSFETGTLGVRGGRVVVYQKADGTIGKAVTPVGSQLNYTSADHTNEEITRAIHFREFGAGRADDFSQQFSNANRAFTLDDGCTTLVCQNHVNTNFGLGDTLVLSSGSGDFWTLTFVGTGLDFINSRNAPTTLTYSVIVDGITTVSSVAIGGTGQNNVVKLVSGLPYGTHTVKLLATSGGQTLAVSKFLVYGPKKPAIPTNAIELADYNVVANFVGAANTASAESLNVSTGVIRKTNNREISYIGTWTVGSIATSYPSGMGVTTATNGDSWSYTFWGTGFEILASFGSTGNSHLIQVDGVNYTGTAIAKSSNGTSTWTPGTSTWLVSGPNGSRLQVTGLTLGVHTVRMQKASATDQLLMMGIDIITPIHVSKSNAFTDLQNTLSVGNQSISDNRKTTPLKDQTASQKPWSQATGITSGPTTTSTGLIPLADMSVAIKTTGGAMEIYYSCDFTNANLGNSVNVQAYVDGVSVGVLRAISVTTASNAFPTSDSFIVPVSAGVHKVDLYWSTSGGTATAILTRRTLKVREI